MNTTSAGGPRIELMSPLVVEGERPHLWSGAAVPDDRIRALALGAFYAPLWNAYNDTLDFGPGFPEDTETIKEQAIDALHGAWSVTDADSARSTWGRLCDGAMHANIYAVVHPLTVQALDIERQDGSIDIREEHERFLRWCERFEEAREGYYIDYYRTWLQAQKLGVTQFGEKPAADAYAWDLTRGAFIVRAAVSAEYLDDDEAWSMLAELLDAAQARYANWRQYAESYVAGLGLWTSRRDLAETKSVVARRRAELARLFIRPTSPWRRVALRPGTPFLSAGPDHGRRSRDAREARAL